MPCRGVIPGNRAGRDRGQDPHIGGDPGVSSTSWDCPFTGAVEAFQAITA